FQPRSHKKYGAVVEKHDRLRHHRTNKTGFQLICYMSKIHAAVTAVHGYVPDYILTNQELETMVDTNDEWITTRTGIKERRILKGEGKATSDMAVPAVNGL